MNGGPNMGAPNGRGGFCLGIVGLLVLLMIIGRCGGSGETPPTETRTNQRSIEDLKARFPRIPANGIRVPPESDLKNPDFDVGGHCLAEERAGRGTFEDCIEVVGRELVAIGGPDQR
jgi:hypothetical protein